MRPGSGDDEAGVASVEFAGMLPWLGLAALVVWQLLLVAGTFSAVENAARTGSRAAAQDEPGAAAAVESLDGWLRTHARVGPSQECDPRGRRDGNRVTVCVSLPVLVPGVTWEGYEIRRSAEFPDT